MSEKNIPYTQELLRKTIHLGSLIFPILYYFLDKEIMLQILLPLTILTVAVDLFSKFNKSVGNLIMKYFGSILREHEKGDKVLLNGASWVLISATIFIFLFPKIIFITAFTILIISDIMAALIGRKYGKHKFFDKSLEGTLAFIFSAFLIIFVIYFSFSAPISYLIFALMAAIFGGVIEAMSVRLKMDDNISIPLSVGLVMWIGEFIAISQNMSYIDFIK